MSCSSQIIIEVTPLFCYHSNYWLTTVVLSTLVEWRHTTLISADLVLYEILRAQVGHFLCPTKKWRCIMLYSPTFWVSIRPSVRPSAVDHLCPLYNFDTVWDNFTKLGRNIKHDQTTCRHWQWSLHLHFLRNDSPLWFSVWKSCPLYDFDTVWDNFTKLGRNIKHDQTTCRDWQWSLHLHLLRNYSPL